MLIYYILNFNNKKNYNNLYILNKKFSHEPHIQNFNILIKKIATNKYIIAKIENKYPLAIIFIVIFSHQNNINPDILKFYPHYKIF